MADPVTSPPLERASIFAAHELIKPYVHRTPVLTNATLTALASTPRTAEDLRGTRWADRADRPARPVLRLWFKCENFQRIGAFKPRGAFHAVERLKLIPGWLEGQGRTNGVVTASSGKFPFFRAFPSFFIYYHVLLKRDSWLYRVRKDVVQCAQYLPFIHLPLALHTNPPTYLRITTSWFYFSSHWPRI